MTEQEIRERIANASDKVEDISSRLSHTVGKWEENLRNELRELRDELITEAFPDITDDKDRAQLELILMKEHGMEIWFDLSDTDDDYYWIEERIKGNE